METIAIRQANLKKLTVSAITMCFFSALFYCYEYYLRVAPSVMKTELQQSFLLTEESFGFLAACYYFAYTPLQIPVGIIMDKLGPRRVLTVACLFCALGTVLFAQTHSLLSAQMGRFLLGFGSAFAYVGILKLCSLHLPGKYFALVAGIGSTLGMVGGMSGEIIMSYMVGLMGWQSTLYYAAIFGILLAALLWIILRDDEEIAKQIHPTSKKLKNNHFEHSKEIFERKKIAITSTNALSKAEISREGDIGKFVVLKDMLLSPQMWINGLIGCLTFLPITAFSEVWAVSFLQATGMSKAEAAAGSSIVFIGFAIGGPLWGVVSDFVQSRKLILKIGAFVSAILMSIIICRPSSSTFNMYCLLFAASLFASVQILVFAISNDFSHSTVTATAAGLTNMLVMAGGALLPPIIGKLLDNGNSHEFLGIETYSLALIVLPISLMLAGLLSFFLKESYPKHLHIDVEEMSDVCSDIDL